MKKIMTGVLAVLACAALILTAAAESLSMEGTVTAGAEVPVYAPIGGTVGEVKAEEGQQVGAEDVLYEMKTAKVYAQEDGTVTGVFGRPGDSAETVAEKYGAVMYIEGAFPFTVAATTDGAYSAAENKMIHAGETVYVRCSSNYNRRGTGIVTAVTGTSYTIMIGEGNFYPGDSVEVYRDEKHTNTQKIGRGKISRVDPAAVTATGAIVRIAAEDGAQVKRGDLLLETLEGTFSGLEMSGTEIPAGQAGVVASVNVARGDTIQQDSIAAVIYPLDTMRAEAFVPEDSRNMIREGDAVTVELGMDESRTYPGTVTLVSSLPQTDENGEVTYRVLADFVPDDAVKIGMHVLITAGEDKTAEAPERGRAEEREDAESTENETSGQSGRRPGGRMNRTEGEGFQGWPEGGWPEGGWPEGMPELPEGGSAETP